MNLSSTHIRMFHTLSRYWRLLAHYLRPQWLRMSALAVILCGTIAVQVVGPLVASRFIDRATAGGGMGELIFLALLTMGLALAAQGMAIATNELASMLRDAPQLHDKIKERKHGR